MNDQLILRSTNCICALFVIISGFFGAYSYFAAKTGGSWLGRPVQLWLQAILFMVAALIIEMFFLPMAHPGAGFSLGRLARAVNRFWTALPFWNQLVVFCVLYFWYGVVPLNALADYIKERFPDKGSSGATPLNSEYRP
jgi:hypothetical protein